MEIKNFGQHFPNGDVGGYVNKHAYKYKYIVYNLYNIKSDEEEREIG